MTHIPLRTCIVTHEKKAQSELVRIAKVKAEDGFEVKLDLKHNLGGRGIYILKDKDILEQAIKKGIVYGLKLGRKLSEGEVDNLRKEFTGLIV